MSVSLLYPCSSPAARRSFRNMDWLASGHEAEFASLVRAAQAGQNGEFAMTRVIALGKLVRALAEDLASLIGLRSIGREGAVDLDLRPIE